MGRDRFKIFYIAAMGLGLALVVFWLAVAAFGQWFLVRAK